jgi:hypothetical protein
VQLHIALQVISSALGPEYGVCTHGMHPGHSTSVALMCCCRQRCSSMTAAQTRTAGLLQQLLPSSRQSRPCSSAKQWNSHQPCCNSSSRVGACAQQQAAAGQGGCLS